MVGSAIWKNLKEKGYENLIGKSSKNLDLRNQEAVKSFFEKEAPDYVFLAAARVGGIMANSTYRAEFIYDNLQIQNNVIHSSYISKVKKLIFLGSSCIYPRNASQPIKEESLLSGMLESTNEPYAIAKIAGIKMCENYHRQYSSNFISVMPTNLYGANDNYDLEGSHVLPALIRKIHLGKALENNKWSIIRNDLNRIPIQGLNGLSSKSEIIKIFNKSGIIVKDEKSNISVKLRLWGTGVAKREFLHVDDMAEACIFLFEKINASFLIKEKISHINIGSGKEISISDLALLIKQKIGFKGALEFDFSKPDGTLRKLMDSSRINERGWRPKIKLENGIKSTYKWYMKNE